MVAHSDSGMRSEWASGYFFTGVKSKAEAA